MNQEPLFFTLRRAEAYLLSHAQGADARPTIRDVLIGMREENRLLTGPQESAPLRPDVPTAVFLEAYLDMPQDATRILSIPEEDFEALFEQEKAAFPPEQDVFCRKLLPGLPHVLTAPEFFELVYVIEGSVSMDFSGDSFTLTAGDICILPPHAPHSLLAGKGSFAEVALIRSSNFDSRFGELMTMYGVFSGFFREALYGAGQPNFQLLHTPAEDWDITFRMRGLIAECMIGDVHTNSCITSWVKLFLVQALRACGDKVEIYRFPTGGNPRADCGEILQYIHQNFRTVRLSTLAKEFHYNETYLSRMLQNYAHQSFTEIVRDIRMNRAVEYLTSSSLRVHEIAGLVGYSSVDHFSRAFKSLYGVSPQGYRRNNKKKS